MKLSLKYGIQIMEIHHNSQYNYSNSKHDKHMSIFQHISGDILEKLLVGKKH